MGKDSGIQWTTHTFNPWIGCQRVSPGCVNCYAEALDKRWGGGLTERGVKELRWGPTAPRIRTSTAYWSQPIAWNRAAEAAGERHRVFCASLADVFEQRHGGEGDLDSWRLSLFELIAHTPHLDWLLLTKRPENVRPLLDRAIDAYERTPSGADGELLASRWLAGEAPHNVWLGTTVEDQARADARIPALLSMPAKVRFLSCEPLLERVNLTLRSSATISKFFNPVGAKEMKTIGIDWVIVGGESGAGARMFDVDWARDIMRQCRRARVAVFVKQLGANAVQSQESALVAGGLYPADAGPRGRRPERFVTEDPAGGDMAEWPEDLQVRELPR